MVLPWLRMIYSRPAVETLSSLFSWVIACKLRPDIRYRVLPVEGGGVEVDTFLPQCTYFVEPGLVECKGFTRIGHGNAPGQVG